VRCVFFKPCTKLTLHYNHRSGHLETTYTESLLLLRRHLGNWSRGPAVSIRSELLVAHILCIPWEHNVPYGANRTEHGTAFLGSLGLVKLEITAPSEGRYSDSAYTLVFNNARVNAKGMRYWTVGHSYRKLAFTALEAKFSVAYFCLRSLLTKYT
jgi:hypothetical protein